MEDIGTNKWCPECKTIRVVEAVKPSSAGAESDQHCYTTNPEYIDFYRRGQQCQTCYHFWLSAEVPEYIIDELVKLRSISRFAMERVEEHSKESEESLARLNKYLNILRNFALYVGKDETRTTS